MNLTVTATIVGKPTTDHLELLLEPENRITVRIIKAGVPTSISVDPEALETAARTMYEAAR